jgi:putative ABC transport system permease protein
MILIATLRIALRALRRNTLRTLLTMLGIIIGVGAVIAMDSIGSGARARLEASVASLGQNVITIMSGSVSRGGVRMGFGSSGTLTADDYAAVRKELPGVSGVSPEVRNFAQIAAGNQNINSQIMGVGADYLEVRSWPCAAGENFTEADVRTSSKIALLGQTTAELLFADEDPIGQIIRIKNAPFRVVGLLARKGTDMWGRDQDDVVLVPYTSAMKRLTGDTTFRSLMLQASAPQIIGTLTNQITELLRQRHKIGPGRDDDFLVRTQQDITEFADSQARVIRELLFYVALISLVVGGIGVMNIMLVSVTERTREIGVRMAVGARGRDVLMQFLTEAVTLSLVGGALGIAIGVGSSKLITSQMGWPTLTSSDSVVLAFGVSAFIGIFFGFYPARKASRLDPIEALRYE